MGDASGASLSPHLGLTANVTTLQQTDLDEPDGDVVLADPDSGVRVEPDSTVSIEVNPTKPTMKKNEDCRPSDAPAAADPGDRPPGYVGDSPEFQDYSGSPYPGIDPRQTSTPSLGIHLYWGTPTWGYRHIAIKRGYGATDAAQTELALSGPLYYQDPPNSNSTTWVFDYQYPETSEDGSALQCQRRVIVQYQQKDAEPEPRHIITSFYGEVVREFARRP